MFITHVAAESIRPCCRSTGGFSHVPGQGPCSAVRIAARLSSKERRRERMGETPAAGQSRRGARRAREERERVSCSLFFWRALSSRKQERATHSPEFLLGDPTIRIIFRIYPSRVVTLCSWTSYPLLAASSKASLETSSSLVFFWPVRASSSRVTSWPAIAETRRSAHSAAAAAAGARETMALCA